MQLLFVPSNESITWGILLVNKYFIYILHRRALSKNHFINFNRDCDANRIYLSYDILLDISILTHLIHSSLDWFPHYIFSVRTVVSLRIHWYQFIRSVHLITGVLLQLLKFEFHTQTMSLWCKLYFHAWSKRDKILKYESQNFRAKQPAGL